MSRCSWGTVGYTSVACSSEVDGMAEGMDGLASTHHSHSRFNGTTRVTDLQQVRYFFVTIHLEELLLQLDVGIGDGSNEPALDFKLNCGITTIASLCMVGDLAYPVYEFIDGFVRLFLTSSSS